MPIMFSDEGGVQQIGVGGQATKVRSISPKYFSEDLTGTSTNNVGILNVNNNMSSHLHGWGTLSTDIERKTDIVKNTKIVTIPMYILPSDLTRLDNYKMKFYPEDMRTAFGQLNGHPLEIVLRARSCKLTDTTTPSLNGGPDKHDKTFDINFDIFFLITDPNTPDEPYQTATSQKEFGALGDYAANNLLASGHNTGNWFVHCITENPVETMIGFHKTVGKYLANTNVSSDETIIKDFIMNTTNYDLITASANLWDLHAAEIVEEFMTNFRDEVIAAGYSFTKQDLESYRFCYQYDHIKAMFNYLETYKLSLDLYQDMYIRVSKVVTDASLLRELCNQNMNLMLSNTLCDLKTLKPQLEFCPNNVQANSQLNLTIAQRNAVETTSPLCLVQSGAGTGKSSVILERISHMIANDIKPEDITVLSFTNAAADHIKELNPSINSMTIAAMMHTIYSANFPSHRLSNLKTLANSIAIYYTPIMSSLPITTQESVRHLTDVIRYLAGKKPNFTMANNIVAEDLDGIIDILNTVSQTTLELESIICYNKMNTLIEPPEVNTKHLIIDEVQDNAVFEFIYSMKFTAKHLCSMYIVGDCSQTLYEFRASNPTALNTLEASGVFETHKLEINFRSNQEILDFANVHLANIEANQFANIRLKANSLSQVTEQSFRNKVQLHYEVLGSMKKDLDAMYDKSVKDMKPYIDACLNAGEQVAILASERATVFRVKSLLETMYPQLMTNPNEPEIISIVSTRLSEKQYFSRFIAKYWNKVQFNPPTNILTEIRMQIFDKIEYIKTVKMASDKAKDDLKFFFGEFTSKYGYIISEWEKQCLNHVLSPADMLHNIQQIMIQFEIDRNSLDQAKLSAANNSRKENESTKNAKIILSTIHSAKGLEFDNVIIYHKAEQESQIDEPTKRKYYVAFTRAKKTELIYSFGTYARPKIQGDYDTLVRALKTADKNRAKLAAQNADPNAPAVPVAVVDDDDNRFEAYLAQQFKTTTDTSSSDPDEDDA